MSEDPLNENDNPKELSIKIMHIKQVKLEDNESEFTNYLGRFFKQCQRGLKLNNIGRSFYDPKQCKEFS
jgi:hypothetical protein